MSEPSEEPCAAHGTPPLLLRDNGHHHPGAPGQRNLRARRVDTSEAHDVHGDIPLGTLCKRIWRAIDAPAMHPGFSLASIKGKIGTLGECLGHFLALRSWHALGQDPNLAGMIDRHPLLPAMPARPYINSAWSFGERVKVLKTHYAMLRGPASALAFPHDECVLLLSLDDVEPGLRIILDKPHWLADEGEVAINLFTGDTRIYSLMFTLGQDDGRSIAYVGAIQGKAGGHNLDENRRLTRAAHGMRPRDLLFAAFRMLCSHLQVDAILAIADACNICHAEYFDGCKNIHAHHDTAWREYKGAPRQDGFFEIAVPIPFRDAKNIPARKRALYRRRYDMLHRMDAALAARLEECRLDGQVASQQAAWQITASPSPALLRKSPRSSGAAALGVLALDGRLETAIGLIGLC